MEISSGSFFGPNAEELGGVGTFVMEVGLLDIHSVQKNSNKGLLSIDSFMIF